MADAADAISNGFATAFNYRDSSEYERLMCWYHVYQGFEGQIRNFKDTKSRDQLTEDISDLQLMYSAALFEYAFKLFESKWSNKSPEIDLFLDYFKKTWIVSKHNKWYEGAAPGLPSSNNALESTNKTIKVVYTLRELLSVGTYMTNATKMLTNMSKDSLSSKKYLEELEVDENTWHLAKDCLKAGPIIRKHDKLNNDSFIITKKSDINYINLKLLLGKYKDLTFDFDTLILYLNKVRIVTLDRENWAASKCTCGYYYKHYFCYHIIAVAVNEKLTTIPIEYINDPIERASKPGRKKKAAKALEKQ